MRVPTDILIHHSATVDGRVFDTRAIRRFHTSWRYKGVIITEARGRELLAQGVKGVVPPWRKIAYHRLLERLEGELELIVGRWDHESAAACPQEDMNQRALHLCCVGNFDLAPPADDVVRRTLDQAEAWRLQYGISVSRVRGHTEVAGVEKTCPGTKWDMDLFREMLR